MQIPSSISTRLQYQHKSLIDMIDGLSEEQIRRQVVPGDVLRIEVQVQKLRGTFGKSYAAAYVGDEMAAEAEMMFGLQK